MKRDFAFVACSCAFVWFCQYTVLLGQEESPGNSSKSPNNNEAGIRKSLASYVEAFNKSDAKAVASHWNEDGEFMTPAGDKLCGRLQLENNFAAYFMKTKDAKIELLDTSIEFLSPSVAQETGIARVLVPGQEPSETEYKAIHVRTSTGWKIDRVHEQQPSSPSPAHREHLRALNWLVGTWVDTDENSSVETQCQWTTNQNFLVRSFKVKTEGLMNFEGTQIIGWDAHAETVRSWTFDSDGGFGVGRWSGDGKRWTVCTLHVLADGRRASGTNIYNRIDENNIQFHSIGRQVDGELMPDINPVSVVRMPDEPRSSNAALFEDSRP